VLLASILHSVKRGSDEEAARWQMKTKSLQATRKETL